MFDRRTLLKMSMLTPLLSLLPKGKSDFELDTEEHGQAFYVWTGHTINHNILGREYNGQFWWAKFNKTEPYVFTTDRYPGYHTAKVDVNAVTSAMFFVKGGVGPTMMYYENGRRRLEIAGKLPDLTREEVYNDIRVCSSAG